MLRSKTIIGRTLRARTLPAQKVEARVGCKVLNRMTARGMPIFRKGRLKSPGRPPLPKIPICEPTLRCGRLVNDS